MKNPLADPFESLRRRAGLPATLPAEPMTLLSAWHDEAVRAGKAPNPNSMILATATPGGAPSARVVLCKSIDAASASLVFYTSYSSRKAVELEANPRAAAVFHWDHAGRQARVEGTVTRVSAAESDAYFRSRPLLSRLGAWASDQDRPLDRRLDLLERLRAVMQRFGVGLHHFAIPSLAPEIPRPERWGGYRVAIDAVELWLGGDGRLHDRAIWTRCDDAPTVRWRVTRIQP